MKEELKEAVRKIRNKKKVNLEYPWIRQDSDESQKILFLTELNKKTASIKEDFEEWLLREGKKKNPKDLYKHKFWMKGRLKLKFKPLLGLERELYIHEHSACSVSFNELRELEGVQELISCAKALNCKIFFGFEPSGTNEVIDIKDHAKRLTIIDQFVIKMDLLYPFNGDFDYPLSSSEEREESNNKSRAFTVPPGGIKR